MSIRIAGQTDINTVETPRAITPKSIESDSRPDGYVSSPSRLADQADLSNASNLVHLAKALVPAGKPEKLAALAARVGSGTYKPASSEVSRSIVQSVLTKK